MNNTMPTNHVTSLDHLISTRESAKKVLKEYYGYKSEQDVPNGLAAVLEDWLHHQLQKAREGCICKDNGVIELLEEQNKEARQKIASLYLPAHEVNHGEDCIECKEIAAYNAALQDAIKALTSKK